MLSLFAECCCASCCIVCRIWLRLLCIMFYIYYVCCYWNDVIVVVIGVSSVGALFAASCTSVCRPPHIDIESVFIFYHVRQLAVQSSASLVYIASKLFCWFSYWRNMLTVPARIGWRLCFKNNSNRTYKSIEMLASPTTRICYASVVHERHMHECYVGQFF